jgi:hypothetical protein
MTVGVRVRVVNVIKSWVTKFYAGIEDDSSLLDIKDWAKQPYVADFLTARNQNLIRLIDDQLKPQDVHKLPVMSQFSSRSARELTDELQDLEVLDVGAVEMARQITLRQVNLYGRIKWIDYLVKRWGGNNANNEMTITGMMDDGSRVVLR